MANGGQLLPKKKCHSGNNRWCPWAKASRLAMGQAKESELKGSTEV